MARKRYFQMPDIDQPDPEPGFQHTSDEFMVPSVDEDGEKVRAWCTLPGKLHAWMADIVLSRKFPFRYEGDLMRYGVYLACQQLCRIDRSVPNLEASIDAMKRAVNMRTLAASVDDHVRYFAAEIEKLQKQRAWGEILYLLAAEKRTAAAYAAQEPYWGQRWQEGIRQHCQDAEVLATAQMDEILKQRPGGGYISLKPSDARRDQLSDWERSIGLREEE
jgi:hypothetical protein